VSPGQALVPPPPKKSSKVNNGKDGAIFASLIGSVGSIGSNGNELSSNNPVANDRFVLTSDVTGSLAFGRV
jgi:hypothetical protein